MNDKTNNMKNKFLIIIPTYNEEKTISTVIKKIKEEGYPFIVVNDGSTDNTLESIFKEVKGCIGYNKNKGKGHAIKLGAKYGQVGIDDIKQFETTLNMPCYYNAKIILGNRLHNPKTMPLIRKITNYIMSYIISRLADCYIADSQCGFRAIHKDVFKLDLKGERFDFESEMLIKTGKNELKIINIPIKCIYNKERQSKIHPIKDLIKFIKLIRN